MTLEEGKNRALALLDEYAVNARGDEDLEARLVMFLDMAQKELSQIKRIVRSYVVEREEGRTEYPMPPDFLSLCRLWRNERPARLHYRWRGSTLLIPAEDTARVEVEYFACPATITAETPGDYCFEVAEDAAQALPFFAAAQVLATDLVQDGSVLMSMYRMLVDELDRSVPGTNERMSNRLFRA